MCVRPGDTMLTFAIYVLLFSALAYSTEHRNFKITRIVVPAHVFLNDKEIDIICEYDANFTILNWFKGTQEFFRYTPKRLPSTMTFPANGVGKIEQVTCGQEKCHLRLSALTAEATGLYKCDLERDEKPYKYDTKSSFLQVEGQEPRKPLLAGVAETYTEGDIIRAYCRGDRDTELRWYINGDELLESRGSPLLQYKSRRDLFWGINCPSIVIQCGEVKYERVTKSNEVKAYWKNQFITTNNGSIKIANFLMFVMVIPIIILSI